MNSHYERYDADYSTKLKLINLKVALQVILQRTMPTIISQSSRPSFTHPNRRDTNLNTKAMIAAPSGTRFPTSNATVRLSDACACIYAICDGVGLPMETETETETERKRRVE